MTVKTRYGKGDILMYKTKKKTAERIFDVLLYGFMIFLVVIFIFPIWQTIVISFSEESYVRELGLKIIPEELILDSYNKVFSDGIIAIGYMNTLIRVAMGTIISVIVTYLAGYSLSKKSLPFRKTILLFIVFTMFFSGGLIPSYLLIRTLGLIDSRWALVLPVATSAWYIMIARNFITTIPSSLEESAFIDGAHPLTVIIKIMIPLSMPIIAVLSLWIAVAHWNAWFDALIYITSKDKMVLQLVLRRVLIEEDEALAQELLFVQDKTSAESVKAATIIVSTIPILCLYPFLQKYFVKGVLIGSLKG